MTMRLACAPNVDDASGGSVKLRVQFAENSGDDDDTMLSSWTVCKRIREHQEGRSGHNSALDVEWLGGTGV